ncbi:MAG: hypothetical protein GX556_13270 [Fibrobacter sp.]|nr:hypothetical protein [Fibrobacter sp.]
MRTDAMLFNLSSGNEMPKSRMDRLQDTGRRTSETGFGFSREPKAASFKDTYRQVARENVNANRGTDSTVESRVVRETRNQDDPAVTRQANCIENQTTDRVGEISDTIPAEARNEEDLNQATEIIKESLQTISEVLQLKVAPELEELNLENVSEETVGQFAEIIEALKGIAGVLEASAAGNEPILTGNGGIDPQKATEMVQVLRTELFRIEIGLNMLGVSEQVQTQVASQMNLPFSGGIPQASSLSELMMPEDQIKKVFGNLIEEPGDGLAALAKKVMELVNQNSERSSNASIQVVSENRPVSVTNIDTLTYRAMLKLEVKEKVSLENSEAAVSGGEKLNLNAALGPVVARDVAKVNSEVEILPIAESIGKTLSGAKNSALFETKMTGNYKSIDESVMNQISQKMHSAVRAGASEVKIQLWPESLGEVKLRIRMDGDVVIAKIQVESQQVKQIVESNLQSLKDSLSEHNLQAGSFDVNVGSGWGRQPGEAGDSSFAKQHNVSGSLSGEDLQTSLETGTVAQTGQETGRRFGSNTVEFFG